MEWNQDSSDEGLKGVLDFTIDNVTDFDASDWGIFDRLCSNVPGVSLSPQFFLTEQAHSANTDHGQEPLAAQHHHIAFDAEAYKRSSLGSWQPGQTDFSAAELENLAVLDTDKDSPETRLAVLSQPSMSDMLQQSTRDKLLAMIVGNCKPEKIHLVLRAFPSAELLDALLRNFFHQHRLQADSIFHFPTFKPNEQNPELLVALIAMGAIATDIKSLHKLGFALQEIVRTTLPSRFEEANSNTRALWAVQAMLCEIEIGLWSGIKRKMEISESHPQVPITMLRRGGRFKRPDVKGPVPLAEDKDEVLGRKWHAWLEMESWKRLAFRAFIVDAQVSIAFSTGPIISFSELAIPLPESQDLWLAENAEQWKIAYINLQQQHAPQDLSLVDYLRRPSEIPDYYDTRFSSLIILHGLWGMVSQHLQLQSVLKASGQSEAAVALRQQELLESLHHFRLNMAETRDALRPETILILELIHMRLHAPLEEIEMFAGKGSLEDARSVLPSLQRWVESPESRRAILHAGQVIGAAKKFAPKQLLGFFPIAVLHASLVMWTYSIVSMAKGARMGAVTSSTISTTIATSTSTLSSSQPQLYNVASLQVCLDGPEYPAVGRFITLGEGTPCLTPFVGPNMSALELVPLSKPVAFLGIVIEALNNGYSNCQTPAEACPPLVENMKQLLRDLGRAATSVVGGSLTPDAIS
ncbi:hypothetical protein SEUCBS139899_001144 [Sporothrix eucalyptigena]|uniref:Xylanolytic transcriptional activator regulatory domain-containing protein n=1 Tax=Sporothrix eucalyptigena TaxID=1812306 RepID=A0ABP0B5F8_9PEZI